MVINWWKVKPRERKEFVRYLRWIPLLQKSNKLVRVSGLSPSVVKLLRQKRKCGHGMHWVVIVHVWNKPGGRINTKAYHWHFDGQHNTEQKERFQGRCQLMSKLKNSLILSSWKSYFIICLGYIFFEHNLYTVVRSKMFIKKVESYQET